MRLISIYCFILASASLSLGGCVSATYRTPQTSVPATFAAYEAIGYDSALDRWWLLFDDAQLSRLIDQGLAAAPDARTALALLDEARAARSQTLSQFDPQGQLTASAAVQRTSVSNTPTVTQGVYSGAFSPSWELDLFGRRVANRSAANADLDAAQFQFEATRQTLAANIAGDLFEARANAVRLAQARDTFRIASDLVRLGERRVAVGIGSRADAASLQADEATARAAVQNYEAQLELSTRTLLVLLGRGTEPLATLPIEANLNDPPVVPAVTPATLLVRRPDIRQAEARLRSAAGNLKLDALALLPTINLTPLASYRPITGPAGYTTGLWSIGAGLAVPLLDRRRLFAQVRGQRARTEQAVIAYENAVQAGFGEAQNNLSLYASDKARLASLDVAEKRARAAFTAQQAGYKAGVVDLTTLLQTERTWRSNLAALSDLRASTLRDSVNVFLALGGGWPATQPATLPPSATINRKELP